MARYTQSEFVTALNAFDYWEVSANSFEKGGAGQQYEGESSLFNKAGGAVPPVFRYLRIFHTYDDDQHRHFYRTVEIIGTIGTDAEVSISDALPPSTGSAP